MTLLPLLSVTECHRPNLMKDLLWAVTSVLIKLAMAVRLGELRSPTAPIRLQYRRTDPSRNASSLGRIILSWRMPCAV